MLNPSDKNLDRLSREAAREHDPGDVLGARSWERLEPRLDRDLGKSSPIPLQSLRRSAFYYVPAIVLLAGLFFFVKQNHNTKHNEPSGSPPSAKVQSIPATETQPNTSSQNLHNSSNFTPSDSSSAAANPEVAHPNSANPALANPVAANSARANPVANPAGLHSVATNPTTATPSTHSGKSTHYPGANTDANPTNNITLNTHSPSSHSNKHHKAKNTADLPANNETTANPSSNEFIATVGTNSPTGTNGTTNTTNTTKTRELTLSSVHSPRSLRQKASISDSALRSYTTKATPSLIHPGKNKSLRIKRNLQFGLTFAPDFSSVNSLTGDKPGRSIGLTVDYQFANRWYLSSGLLLDRKNYAARQQDYHASTEYYQQNNMHNVNLIKGSFNMLEIPVNIRYDFSVAGNTLFFASAGFSSYLLTNENSNYYYNLFGREDCRSFNYSNKNNYFFSSINLSVGVETGLSNSLSLLIAPYIKIPSRNIGFGQVQMNSVGINLALKFAPVTSRKRK